MNLILVDSLSHKQKLTASDRRSVHIKNILTKGGRGKLFVGCKDGPLGKAEVFVENNGDVSLIIEWLESKHATIARKNRTLLTPYSRPQTCRKILRNAAVLGLSRVVFFNASKAEKAYARSSLWNSDEWFKQLLVGVEQAFDPAVPIVDRLTGDMEEALGLIASEGESDLKIVLDNYESKAALGPDSIRGMGFTLAVGPERGWSDNEREMFRNAGYDFLNLGHRVMRTETAVVAACSVISACDGSWSGDTTAFIAGDSR